METEKIGMPWIQQCIEEIELKENLIDAFRAGEISANEFKEIWTEDSIKI